MKLVMTCHVLNWCHVNSMFSQGEHKEVVAACTEGKLDVNSDRPTS